MSISSVVEDGGTDAPGRGVGHEARLIVNSMPGLGWSADPSGRFVHFGLRAREYAGIPADADGIGGEDGFGWTHLLHPDDVDRATGAWLRCVDSGDPFETEFRIRRCDGSHRWFRASAQAACDGQGRTTGWYGTMIDIEEQRQVQEALGRSERQLRLLVDTIPALAWSTTSDGEVSYASRRMLDYLGLSGEEPFPMPVDAMHPDDVPAFRRAWAAAAEAGSPLAFTCRLRRGDGDYRWHEGRAEPVRDQSGRVIQWCGVNIDVDERQKVEEALRTSAQQLRLLIETIPALVWCVTPEGEPSYLSKQLMGLTQAELESPDGTWLGGAIQAFVHPDDAPALRESLMHSFRTGDPFRMKYRHRRSDGIYRWVEGRALALRAGDGRIVQWYGVLVDIDDETRGQEELRRAQDRLARASQLTSLAELSASIAHEINQPLAAVVTTSHACQHWLSADPPNIPRALAASERIIRDANGAAAVVNRIRALFQRSEAARQPADMNEVIAEVCQLLRGELAARNVRVETDLERNLPPALVDRVQMQQVLVNLIRNGIDAVASPDGASRPLSLRSRRDDAGRIVIEVRDEGAGVLDTERIFEPFFTTREFGMGMGLTIARRIVEAHDGRLWAAPNQPAGAVFTFAIPAEEGEPP
ncbi:PAS domain-containing protein [Arenibaculum pallidiluteum]|uniref:PAS domain-containing protein n=1 Tax=Arenibaculum pallidiluteum TaxID=2812559 RepID=UPI001A975B9D|nr:PAS domain-containing protein [Arenibaculum pallidiluteum]